MKYKSWHDDVYFGIHYDFHADEKDTVIGRELTKENLLAALRRVRPDWIQCDCKGHAGWASWPSQTGPSAARESDPLQIHIDACCEIGIPLGMHYSGIIDREQIKRHPEWAQIDADGKPSEQSTCRLSPYLHEFMLPQMMELIDRYDVNGFWVDGDNWAVAPCWCERCIAEFEKRTGIDVPPKSSEDVNWNTWLEFHRNIFVEYVTAWVDAVHERKPDCAVCSNWMYSMRMPDPIQAPIDYLSGDYMPNFGIYRAAMEARFLSRRGISWDLMCWGFTQDHTNPSYTSWKTTEHLCQEVTEVIAHGGAIMVYDQPQRTGHLISWHRDILGEVADFCRARKEYCFKTGSFPQAAVLHSASHYYRNNDPCFNLGDVLDPIEGALHALLETGHSVDILNEEMVHEWINEYKLLVVPEQTCLSDALVKRLEQYAEGGGTVVLSGSCVSAELGGLTGTRSEGRELCDPAQQAEWGLVFWGAVFLEIDGEAAAFSGPWADIELTEAELHTPALTGGDPTKDQTTKAAISVRHIGQGRIFAVHGPVFRQYFQNHCPRARRFFDRFFREMEIDWTVEIDAPPQVELVLRRKEDSLMVNLINRGAGMTTCTQRPIIEQVPSVENIQLRIRCETRPDSMVQQPENRSLDWSWDAGENIARVTVPLLHIHSVIVLS